MQAEGEDSLKKMQLMELAILNGTYRDANIKSRKYDRTVGFDYFLGILILYYIRMLIFLHVDQEEKQKYNFCSACGSLILCDSCNDS